MTGTNEWDVDVVSVDLAGEPRRYAASYNPNTSGWFMNQFRQIESDRTDRPGWIWVLTDAEDFLPDVFLHELERGDAGLSGRDHEDPQTEYGLSDLTFPTFEITGPSELAGTWYPREAVDEAIASLRESIDEAWQAAHAANATAALAGRRVEQLEEERDLIGAKLMSGSDEIASLRADLALHEGLPVSPGRAEALCPDCKWPATKNPWGGAGRCPNTAFHEGNG